MALEEQLFARHIGKRVLLDSNLLLVLLSGALGESFFRRFKRVSRYKIEDYELLLGLLGSFRVLLTTPHILTEVCNLANAMPERYKQDWYFNLASLVTPRGDQVELLEKWEPVSDLCTMTEFASFGITDAALTRLSSEALVVTEDYRLSGALRSRGIDVLNFRDLRQLRPLAND